MIDKTEALSIIGGRLICESGIVPGGALEARGGKIVSAGAGDAPPRGTVINARGCYVSPGFIDLHVHGAAGADFLGGGADAARKIASVHARYGTTCMLASVGTGPLGVMRGALERLRAVLEGGGGEGIIGINLEGPYLNPSRCGAHSPEHLRSPDAAEMEELAAAAGGFLRIVTLAPELPGADGLISLLASRGIIPAAGHSEASFEEAAAAFDAGVCHVTHLFNAMSGAHHRRPGLSAAALMDARVTAELIADGIHVHPLLARLALRLKGTGSVALVTDCMEALDSGRQEFSAGGRRVSVRGGAPVMDDGILCGSVLTMNRAVANIIRFAGIGIIEAVALAAGNPARVLGLSKRKGSLAPGKDADITVFDDALDVKATVVGGKIVYNSL